MSFVQRHHLVILWLTVSYNTNFVFSSYDQGLGYDLWQSEWCGKHVHTLGISLEAVTLGSSRFLQFMEKLQKNLFSIMVNQPHNRHLQNHYINQKFCVHSPLFACYSFVQLRISCHCPTTIYYLYVQCFPIPPVFVWV